MESMDHQSDRRKKWKNHLQEENCVEVRKLLIPHGHDLLTEGWSEVAVHPSSKLKPARLWKGRTALHVAVRRGDVKLVEDILNISYPLKSASVASKEHGSIGSTDMNDPGNHMLEVVDNDYELDALGMAIVNGNNHIVNLLKGASLRCGWNPYEISHDRVDDKEMDGRLSAEDEDIKRLAETLSEVTEAALLAVTQSETWNKEVTIETMKEWYRENYDFNFIDIDLDMHLFFHCTFSAMSQAEGRGPLLKLIREEIISGARPSDELLEFLLIKLKDGQGRTALHVAVDYNNVVEFRDAIDSITSLVKKDRRKILNAKDTAGRTPLYRAAAKSLFWPMDNLLYDTSAADLHTEIKYDAQTWGDFGIDIDKVSWKNGFRSDCVYISQKKLDRKGFNRPNTSQDGTVIKHLERISCTALHVAIIHQHEKIVDKILEQIEHLQDNHDGRDFASCSPESCKDDRSVIASNPKTCKDDHSAFARSPDCKRLFSWPVLKALQANEKASYPRLRATTMQLTVLVGSVPILQKLLKAEATWANSHYFDTTENLVSFLLAAAMGNPAVIKAFLDSKEKTFDYTVCDAFGSTALHHALRGRSVQLLPHLLDFVGCQHVYSSRWNNDAWVSQWLANPLKETLEVQGLEEKNNQHDQEDKSYGQRRGTINLLLEAGIDIWKENDDKKTASPDPDAEKTFVEWWYDKVAKETKGEQTKLSDAANAITVTAALVATASYVGPLTPPLGYSDGDALRLNILAVRIFVVCDSLSFYFALAAIMLALLPALPLQSESMFRELERTRIVVAFAVSFLFPSILCVLVAFATGYIAASPDHGLSHHGLTVGITVVGVFCCFVVIIAFFMRLLKVLRDRLRRSPLEKLWKCITRHLEVIFEPTGVPNWLEDTKETRRKVYKYFSDLIHLKFLDQLE